MDAACTIQDSIHVFSLVHKYVSRILGTYHLLTTVFMFDTLFIKKHLNISLLTPLRVIQIRIESILRHKLIMVTLLYDVTVLHNKDDVCILDG